MSYAAVSKCPFLTKVSTNFLRHAGGSLGMYGQRCPVMSKLFHTAVGSARSANRQPITLGKFLTSLRCVVEEDYVSEQNSKLNTSLCDSTCVTVFAMPFLSLERFYMTAHGSVPRASTSGGKCPFRAALQTQNVHTSATQISTASSKEKEKEVDTTMPGCKCVAEGLRPRGEAKVNLNN